MFGMKEPVLVSVAATVSVVIFERIAIISLSRSQNSYQIQPEFSLIQFGFANPSTFMDSQCRADLKVNNLS